MKILGVTLEPHDVVTVLFVVLKKAGAVDWDWLWVLSPLWIGYSLSLGNVLIQQVIAQTAACNAQANAVGSSMAKKDSEEGDGPTGKKRSRLGF
jgi:hypothetical protein